AFWVRIEIKIEMTVFRLPGICLMVGLFCLSCTVSQVLDKPPVSYILKVVLPPRQEGGALMGLLAEAGAMPELLACCSLGDASDGECLRVRVRLHNEAQRRMVLDLLYASAVGIQQLQLTRE